MDKKVFMGCIATLVSLGGILYGYDIGVISGALLFIQDTIPMTDTQVGIIVGAVLGGGLIGTLLAGPIADNYGRRLLIFFASFIFILGVSFILIAFSFLMILAARILLGIGVGLITVGVPLYVAEIVPAEDRGKYMTIFQLLLTFGILLAYVVDLLFTPSGNWRAMFAVVLIPALILFFGTLFLPETPRWLIANREEQRARQVLLRIRTSSPELENEIKVIQSSLKEISSSWFELLSKPFWLPTCVALLISIFSQLTGINSLLQYAPYILKNAGTGSDLVTMMGSTGIGALNLACTIIALLLIDSVGRRPLLLIGLTGVMLALGYLGLIHLFPVGPSMLGLLALIGLFVFIIFFAIGPGVVIWLIICELFPTRIRGKGIALCLFFNSLASTLLAIFFLPLSHSIGMSQTYWLFAFFTFLYFLVAYFFLPETKSKSLEEIQFDFQKEEAQAAQVKT